MFCPQCGTENKPNAKFCTQCGHALQSDRGTDTDGDDNGDVGQPRLWNPNAVANWSLLFTPIFGSYLNALNWEEIGEKSRAGTSRVWMWVSIAIVLIAVFTPQGGAAIGFVYLIIWYFASGRKQARFVKEAYNNDYHHKKWLKPLSIALGVYVGVIVLGVILIVASGVGGRDYYVEGDVLLNKTPRRGMNALERQMDSELRTLISTGVYTCERIEKLLDGVNKAPNVELRYSDYCGPN